MHLSHMRDTGGVPIICEYASTCGCASTAMASSYICIQLPHAHHGVDAGMSKFLVERHMLTGSVYCTYIFSPMTAPHCLQAEAFHPCSVRFYFGTGRLRGQELAATPAFPLLHGNEHNLGQNPGSASGTRSKIQSFFIPPTLCIEGSFEVCFPSSKM